MHCVHLEDCDIVGAKFLNIILPLHCSLERLSSSDDLSYTAVVNATLMHVCLWIHTCMCDSHTVQTCSGITHLWVSREHNLFFSPHYDTTQVTSQVTLQNVKVMGGLDEWKSVWFPASTNTLFIHTLLIQTQSFICNITLEVLFVPHFCECSFPRNPCENTQTKPCKLPCVYCNLVGGILEITV